MPGSGTCWRRQLPSDRVDEALQAISGLVTQGFRRGVDFASTGWKDTVLVEGRARLLVRLSQSVGDATPCLFHCHILGHEDAGMMGPFVVT